MGEGHHHSHSANKKILIISLIIITFYMVIEVIGGIFTKSLALFADAGHMFSDAISLFIALIAFTMSSKTADYRKTYGYKRLEVLAAIINGVTLILISGYITYEAIERFQNPREITTGGMLIIAFLGLLINILIALIMVRGGNVKENINMRGAYLHVISDMLGSVGAIIAAVLIMFFGWNWADPLASIVVSILVLRSGYLVTKSSIHILMEGVPANVDVEEVIENIQKIEGVLAIHDLHIWTITSGFNVLTCHVEVDEKLLIKESDIILQKIEHELEHMNIHHVTIQIETLSHKHKQSVWCGVQVEPTNIGHHH